MANFRYSHLFTTKTGNAAIQAAAAKLNAAEIALAITDGEEKILFKNANGDVVAVATEEQIAAMLDNKTDYAVNGTNGRALMFNEIDGGGAKFEHNDGTWSFAGVNDGGKNGLAAQVYAVDSQAGYKGTKLDVTVGGLYYTKGEESGKPVAERDVEANEVATKGNISAATVDLKALIEAEEARAISAETALQNAINAETVRAASAETVITDIIADEIDERKAQAVASVNYDSSGKTIDFYNANNVKIDSIDATDFIKDGMIESVSLETTGGTTYLVIVWNTAAGKETTRLDIGDIFDADNYYTKDETDAEILVETNRAISAETALQTALDEETSARTAADAAEATARQNADVASVAVDANAGITLTLGNGSTIVATEAEEITLSAGEF